MTAAEDEPVLVERDGAVAVVRLNRPRSRNALNSALLTSLQDALDTAADDADVRAIVLTGNGPSFCAGADLKEFAAAGDRGDFFATYARTTQSMRLHESIPKLAKPVIAAVRGHALAGGCGVAMSCDLVIAGDQAVFGYPEVIRGQVPALVMAGLARVVGRRHALDLLLTGRTIGADEGLEMGMVNRVVPDAQVLDEALGMAREIAGNSASAVRLSKDLYYRVEEGTYSQALRTGRDANLLMRHTGDSREGAQAFADRQARTGQV